MISLPHPILEACQPLFDAHPLDIAMAELVGGEPKHAEVAASVVASPVIAAHPALVSAIWLYVDDLHRSHEISQGIATATGSLWHGIMHRREGDYANSLYWMQRAADHPLIGVLAPDDLVKDVRSGSGSASPKLVDRQRAEWRLLFEWCAKNP